MSKLNSFKKRLGAAYRAFNTVPDKKAAPGAPQPPKPAAPAVVESPIITNDSAVTVKALNPDYCCGCGACYNSCPVDAITMQHDKEGFLAPVIDNEKCISCGICRKTCPVINTPYKNSSEPKCYAVMADDEIRKDSSSGGMFTLAADYVLKQGGYVCGAALTSDFSVEHIIISDPDELYRFRGSKYVQSSTNRVFTEIKKLLDDGKLVLFSGTPCQVAGLNNYLKKAYENLITVDLVCHGAPSQKVFSKYLDDYYGKENLSDFKFRTKKFGYNSFNQIAYLKDGSEVAGNIKFDAYERTMHSGLALKRVCADCMFAEAPRQGDITIGDFWGVSKYKAELNDNLGTSCALVNNEKGEKFFESITGGAKLLEEVPFDFARHNNRFGRKMRTPGGRRWFFQMLESQPIDKAVEYSLKRKFDVGVIGLWYGRNYGSMATYFALHQVLTNIFHLSVLMIENPLKPNNEADMTKTHPRKIASEFYDVSAKYSLDDLYKLNSFCDTFVVGSDQLWNVGLSRPYKQTYFLGFVNEKNKKIAYGTSFGKEYHGSEEEKLISSHNLQRFDHVSVRDQLSHSICENEFNVEATEVCDPTFLCPLSEYQKLIDKADINETEDYILSYVLDPNENIGRELEQLSIAKNCKVIVLLDEVPWLWEKNVEKLQLSGAGNVEIKREVDLYEWMWYYSHAKSVVTDSFHGTIFSIIFEKPFVTLINQRRGAQRFISLLTPLNLTDRLIDGPEHIAGSAHMLDELDYALPNEKLNEIRSNSMSWLKNALFSTKNISGYSIYPVIDNRLNENAK